MSRHGWEKWWWHDWLTDLELQNASAATRGIWVNLLGHMWLNNVSELTLSEVQFCRLGGCSEGEMKAFIEDVYTWGFCDVSRTCHAEKSVTVTVMSRRRAKEEKTRENNRIRKARQRCHAKVTPLDADADADAEAKKDQKTPPDPSLKTRSGGSDNRPRDPPQPPPGGPGGKSRKRGNGKDLEAEEKVEGLSLRAWQDYLTYRKERRIRPLTPTGAARQRRWLADQGDAAVQQAIVDATIRNGWQGLFALKSNDKQGPTRDQLLDAIGYTGPRETGTTIEGELEDDDERR